MEQSVNCRRDKGRAENTLAGRLNSGNGDASLDAKCKKRAGEVDGWQLRWLVASRTHARGLRCVRPSRLVSAFACHEKWCMEGRRDPRQDQEVRTGKGMPEDDMAVVSVGSEARCTQPRPVWVLVWVAQGWK